MTTDADFVQQVRGHRDYLLRFASLQLRDRLAFLRRAVGKAADRGDGCKD